MRSTFGENVTSNGKILFESYFPYIKWWLCNLHFPLDLGTKSSDVEALLARQFRITVAAFLNSQAAMGIEHKYFAKMALAGLLGFSRKEALGQSVSGRLDDLRAAVILRGPFKLALTSLPSEHLTFDRLAKEPVLRILALDTIYSLYVLEHSGIARSAPFSITC